MTSNLSTSLLIPTLDKQAIPRVIAVRGLGRGDGATSIASNLALLLAMQEQRVLLLDLCLWNNDLTTTFGFPTGSSPQELATEFIETGNLAPESLRSHLQRCRSSVDLMLLPGMEHWLRIHGLRETVGWDFIHALLLRAKADQICQSIIVDLGSHNPHPAPDQARHYELKDYVFFPACAVPPGDP